jgi:hypothetical protein
MVYGMTKMCYVILDIFVFLFNNIRMIKTKLDIDDLQPRNNFVHTMSVTNVCIFCYRYRGISFVNTTKYGKISKVYEIFLENIKFLLCPFRYIFDSSLTKNNVILKIILLTCKLC